MATQIKLGDIAIDVVRKDIKNLHLSVYPPAGKVRISAPKRMTLDTIRVFAISKLAWIKKQQQKLQEQVRETPREYLDRESHYLWGKRYLFKVEEKDASAFVSLNHDKMVLHIRPGASDQQKQDSLAEWYREQLKIAVPPLISKWEPPLGVKVEKTFFQRMKTRWGSCNYRSHNIRLNTELAKKLPECLEYVVVHEMVHLLEASHNSRFVALMDQFMPKWKFYKDELSRAPLGHEDWEE
jgi:predicted metal-dependent hydrolase